MSENNQKLNSTVRPPVVVVMGHIDHGKSTLLDYIRKTNVTENEKGGITQKISAYEVLHKDEHGKEKKITFLDTPGHEAFSKMRERGAQIADVAILVVAADDSVKPQTTEAWKTILESKTPCIVAINKIDKAGANIEKTKTELAEHEIYLENYGGKIPYVEISGKTGEGVDNLLSLIVLLAEMENFTGSPQENASGFVLEANLDSKRGIEATLIIKDGHLEKGMTVAAEDCICSTRIIENFKGVMINEANASAPVRIFGFNKIPKVGSAFKSFKNKKEAEKYTQDWEVKNLNIKGKGEHKIEENTDKKIIPILLKADVSGTLEAIEKEIAKIKTTGAEFKIINKGVGTISESDIKSIASNKDSLVIGFSSILCSPFPFIFKFFTSQSCVYFSASFLFLKDLKAAPTFGILLKPKMRTGAEAFALFIITPLKFSIMRVEQMQSSAATVIPFSKWPSFIIRVASMPRLESRLASSTKPDAFSCGLPVKFSISAKSTMRDNKLSTPSPVFPEIST